MPEISPHTRLRRSPYYDATLADGAVSFASYNKMLLPTGYGNAELEYRRLVDGVSMWDVSVQRQIQVRGPDAARLVQVLSPRDMSTCVVGQGKYVPMCNHAGSLINDPVVLKIAEDCFWMSIADSDLALWAGCVASERNFDVDVSELEVAPLAVQGPMAEDVVAAMFGDWVRDLRPFRFADAALGDIELKVARSGWSKQGGFELYLLDRTRGVELWSRVKQAGEPWGIGPGYPNPSERIESGLLSWGGDTDRVTNPFEVRLERFVDLDVPDDVIGIDALRSIAERGPARKQLGVVLAGDEPRPDHHVWWPIYSDGAKIGMMTNGTWSFKLERNIGFGLVDADRRAGEIVNVVKDGRKFDAKLTNIPFRREDR